MEAGCRGLCCYNQTLAMSNKEFKNFLPDGILAKEVGERDFIGISALAPILSIPGLIYTRKEGRVAVQMVGPCPKLDQETWDCRIHETRPQVCKNFLRGGEDCSTTRHQAGLPPVQIELMENP